MESRTRGAFIQAILLGALALSLSACGNIKGGISKLLGSSGTNVVLRPDQVNISVDEGTTVLFAVVLSEKRSTPTSVDIALANVSGGATDDIQGLPSHVTIPANTLSKLVQFTVPPDSTYEGPEAFTITLSITDATISVQDPVITVDVRDLDSRSMIAVSSATRNVAESVGTGSITVTMTPKSAHAVTVPYTFTAGSATVGVDYTAADGSLTFSPGETSKTISFSVSDDGSPETSETFTLTLDTPVGDADLDAVTQQTISILDNDTTFPAFNITGLTSGSDSSQDANLNGSLSPTVNWEEATGAANYDVTIYASDGTTVVCATQNTITAVLSFTPAACTLTAGQTYKVKVLAKNADSSYTLAAANDSYSFFVNTAPTAVDDGPLYLMSGGSLSFDPRLDNPATGGSDADSDAEGHTLTISAKTDGAKGTVTITGGGTGLTYTPGAGETGVDTFTYTISDGYGGTATADVEVRIMTAHTWTGQVSNSWSTGGNWCGSINGANTACVGGTVPDNSKVAIFDDTCSGTACDATIDAAADVLGLRLNTGYTGTLSQGTGNTIYVGSSGWIQKAGTFVGSDADITDENQFELSGGSFTATSGIWTVDFDLTISGGTFNANGGTLRSGGWSANTSTGSAVFHNVEFIAPIGAFVRVVTGTMTIAGSLTINVNTNFEINTGTVAVAGDVNLIGGGGGGDGALKLNGSGAQTFTGTAGDLPSLEIAATGTVNLAGTIRVNGNFTYTSGTVNAGTSTVVLGSYDGTLVPGPIAFNNVKFEGPGTVAYDVTGTMIVNGDFTANTSNFFNINTGTIAVKGDVYLTDGDDGGDGTLKLNGTGTQTLTGGAATVPNLEIASTGTVDLVGTIYVKDNFTYSSGTVNAGTSTVVISSFSGTIASGAMLFNDVRFEAGGSIGLTITGTMKIAGDFTCNAGSNCAIDGGTLAIGGDVTMASGTVYGSASILLNGTTDQTITPTVPGWPSGNVTVNKSSGRVLLAGNVDWSNASQTLVMTSGVVELNAHSLTVDALTMSAGTKIFRGCSGTLTVGGVSPPDGAYDSGVIVGGDATYLSIDDVTVSEADGSAVFTVSLDQLNCGTVTVDYATADGTASSSGAADYTSKSGTLTFTASTDLTKTISVPITQDALACESNETYTVGLSNAAGSLIADNSGLGTITDDDSASITVDDVAVVPGVGATFTVRRSNTCGNNTTVNYATSDGTASAGSDYTAAGGTVTIPSAGSSATFTIATAANPGLATSKTFNVQLSSNSEGTITDSQGVGTIAAPTFNYDLTSSLTSTVNGHTLTITRASNATYFDSDRLLKIASPNVARFDHDPVTGQPLGLLIEESRTNLLLHSQNLTISIWSTTNASVAESHELAPDGLNQAFKLTENTVNGRHKLDQWITPSDLAASTNYAVSVFAKSAGRTTFRLSAVDKSGGWYTADFDLSAGTVTTGAPPLFDTGIQSIGNGWYRCWMTFNTSTGSPTDFWTVASLLSGGSDTYAGDSSSGIYLWGWQLEQGTNPTSYIPTGTSRITRAADDVDASDVSWHNLAQSTYVATAYLRNLASGHQFLFNQTDGPGDETFAIRRDSNTHVAYYVSSGAVDQAANFDMGNWSAGETKTIAAAAAQNDFAAAVSGTVTDTDNSGTMPTAISSLRVGRVYTDGYLNGHLSRLKYYSQRLTDASLQTLSTEESRPTLYIEDATVNEGGNLTFTVKLSSALASDVSVNWAASAGTATLGSDTSGSTSGTVTITGGSTSATITIATTDDTVIENDEMLTVALSSSPATVLAGDTTATGTIRDASLNLDFTAAPTVSGVVLPGGSTFKRVSSATYFDSQGVLKTSASNLCLDSENFSTSNWSPQKSSVVHAAVAGPDARGLADWVIEDASASSTHFVRSKEITITGNATYTASTYVKAAGRSVRILVRDSNNIANYFYAHFKLTAGVVGTSAGVGNAASAPATSMTSLGNGWYRISVSGKVDTTTSGSILAQVLFYTYDETGGVATYDGDGAKGFYIWGAQFEAGSTPTDYIPTGAAINYAPRIDHDPATCSDGTPASGNPTCTRKQMGLLMEGAVQNKVLYSEQFNQADWIPWTTAVTADVATAPDGTTTADLLHEDSSTDQHDFQQSVTIGAGDIYTWSVFAKNPTTNGRRYLALALCNTGGANCARVRFDLSNGSVPDSNTVGSGLILGYSTQEIGDGWYRLRVTGQVDTTSTTLKAYMILHDGTSYTYAGDGVSGIYLWGAQLEIDPFAASSYIRTTSAGAWREADEFSVAITRSWYSSSAWTINSDAYAYGGVLPATGGASTYLNFFELCGSCSSSSPDAIGAWLRTSDRLVGSHVYVGSVWQGESVGVTGSNGPAYQVATQLSSSQITMTHDGTTYSTSSTLTIPKAERLYIGGYISRGADMYIRSFQYFPRALNSTQLTTFTTD